MDDERIERRDFLTIIGTAGTGVVAGCSGGSDDEAPTTSSRRERTTTTDLTTAGPTTTVTTTTSTATATPTETTDTTVADAETIGLPSPSAVSGAEPDSYSGTEIDAAFGKTVAEVDLRDGLVLVEWTHEGDGGFTVNLDGFGAAGKQEIYATGDGPFDGASAGYLPANRYRLNVNAAGDWMVRIRQPRATKSEATTPPVRSSGTGNTVVGPVQFEGEHRLRAEHFGSDRFNVDFHHQTVGYKRIGNFYSDPPSAGGEKRFDARWIGWVDVYADGEWELTIT